MEIEPNSIVFSGLAFALGCWVKHRFDIAKDKRKEFNEIAKSPFLILTKQMEGAEDGLLFDGFDDWTMLLEYTPKWHRGLFIRRINRYLRIYYEVRNSNEIREEQFHELSLSLKKLLRHIKPR